MKLKTIALLPFLCSLSYADDLKISYSSQNSLILSSASCEKLLAQEEAICRFKEKTEKFVEMKRSQCYRNSSGTYSITISKCLPKFIKAYQHKKNYKSGANCWGTAMNFKSLSKLPRFVWQKEMIYWMNSPLCRKLEVNERKEPGDILNIYGPEYIFHKDEESNKGVKFWNALFPNRLTTSPVKSGYSGYHQFLHAETYLTDVMTFGKDSPSKDDRFEFHNMNEVYGRSREERCQENQSMSAHFREYQKGPEDIKGRDCDYFSLAYRCQNMDDFFNKQNLSDENINTLQEIDELKKVQEKLFSLLITYKKTYSQKEITEILSLADREASKSLNLLSHGRLEKIDEMLLVYKYFTAQGIRKSLELADLTPPTEEL